MRISDEGHYISLAEVKNLLENEEDLKEEQRDALEHAKEFSKLELNEAKDLAEELSKLELTENLIYEIINILPQDTDAVISVLSADRSKLKDETIRKVLDAVLRHSKE
jgi:DNA-directed RNA polymerase subunit F